MARRLGGGHRGVDRIINFAAQASNLANSQPQTSLGLGVSELPNPSCYFGFIASPVRALYWRCITHRSRPSVAISSYEWVAIGNSREKSNRSRVGRDEIPFAVSIHALETNYSVTFGQLLSPRFYIRLSVIVRFYWQYHGYAIMPHCLIYPAFTCQNMNTGIWKKQCKLSNLLTHGIWSSWINKQIYYMSYVFSIIDIIFKFCLTCDAYHHNT